MESPTCLETLTQTNTNKQTNGLYSYRWCSVTHRNGESDRQQIRSTSSVHHWKESDGQVWSSFNRGPIWGFVIPCLFEGSTSIKALYTNSVYECVENQHHLQKPQRQKPEETQNAACTGNVANTEYSFILISRVYILAESSSPFIYVAICFI